MFPPAYQRRAYKEWIEMYDDDLMEIWQKERSEMQKVAMLISALKKELRKVQANVELELFSVKQQLKYKDILGERAGNSSKSPDKEDSTELESQVLF